jgi:hypothetical protein
MTLHNSADKTENSISSRETLPLPFIWVFPLPNDIEVLEKPICPKGWLSRNIVVLMDKSHYISICNIHKMQLVMNSCQWMLRDNAFL